MIDTVRPEELVDSPGLTTFLTDYSPRTDSLDFLINQHLLENTSWNPVVAGILLFGQNPQAVLPRRCGVKIARYETKEDEPERDHLANEWTVEGPLYQVIIDTNARVSEIMRDVKIWTSEGLRPVNYPPETIWEIVTNAVIHRDYSISDDVQIHIFNNRIEVLSPGKLPGYVTVDNILDARYSRNSKIVRTLNRYKNPPNKDLGEGLNTAFQKMKEFKLKPPKLSEEANYFKVIIGHTPLASPEKAILDYLEHHDSVKNAEAREFTGIKSENAVKSVFLRLAKEGFIERVPGLGGSAARWQRTKKHRDV